MSYHRTSTVAFVVAGLLASLSAGKAAQAQSWAASSYSPSGQQSQSWGWNGDYQRGSQMGYQHYSNQGYQQGQYGGYGRSQPGYMNQPQGNYGHGQNQTGFFNRPQQNYAPGPNQTGFSNGPYFSGANFNQGWTNSGANWLSSGTPGPSGNSQSFSSYPRRSSSYYTSNNSYASSAFASPSYSSSVSPAPAFSNDPIYIRGCDEVDLSFQLIADSQTWTRSVSAGRTYKCTEDRAWSIEFHRGGGHGYQRYDLHSGLYEFRAGDRGWELYRVD